MADFISVPGVEGPLCINLDNVVAVMPNKQSAKQTLFLTTCAAEGKVIVANAPFDNVKRLLGKSS